MACISLSLSDHSKSGTDGSTTPSKNPRTNPQMQITAPSTILGLSPLSVYSSSSYWSRFSSVWDFGLVSYGSTALFPRLVWTCEAADCSHEWSMTSSGSGRPSSVEHSPFGLSSLAPEGTESSNPVRLRLAKLHCMHCIGATSCLHREGDLRLHVNGLLLRDLEQQQSFWIYSPGCRSTTTTGFRTQEFTTARRWLSALLQDSSAGLWAGLARPQNIPHNFSSSRQINRLQISHGILYSDALEKRSQGSQNLRRPVRAAPSLPPPSAAFPFPPVEELDALRTCLCSQRSGLSLFALLFSFPLKFPFSLLLVIRIVRASWEHRDANPQIPTAISLSLLSLISFSRSIAGSSCHDGKKHPKFLAGAWPFNLGSNTLISSSTPFTCFSIFASANIVPATWHCRQKDQRVKAWWRGPGMPGMPACSRGAGAPFGAWVEGSIGAACLEEACGNAAMQKRRQTSFLVLS